MTAYVDRSGLKIAEVLARFVEDDVLPPLGMDPGRFWSGVADVFGRFAPENRALLAKREDLQARIDSWHKAHPGAPQDPAAYQAFLREIGYLVPSPRPSRSTRPMSMTSSPVWPDRSWWCRSSTPASC